MHHICYEVDDNLSAHDKLKAQMMTRICAVMADLPSTRRSRMVQCAGQRREVAS
jgi:hypothetical protein